MKNTLLLLVPLLAVSFAAIDYSQFGENWSDGMCATGMLQSPINLNETETLATDLNITIYF